MARQEVSRILGCAMLLLLAVLGIFVPFAIGLVLIYQWSVFTWKAYDSQHWPHTEGWVVEASSRSVEKADESVDSEYHIEYEYVVNGQRYRSTMLTLEPMKNLEVGALNKLSRSGVRLGRGQPVRVFYNPANPAEALLIAGTPPHWSSLAIGAVMAGIPVCILWYGWHRRGVSDVRTS